MSNKRQHARFSLLIGCQISDNWWDKQAGEVNSGEKMEWHRTLSLVN
ncbi:Single-stranded DNA-binding protein [Xenorhabdus bovienii]|uniref:Single-stranded DNA-binding protein n=1 Tax=Xenorhabdus bovienii TaxID=40576 RepID=A0A0B6X429_XENBV|nr:Single-stranded DNA-binding protein [Xenorhabdus bovienii]